MDTRALRPESPFPTSLRPPLPPLCTTLVIRASASTEGQYGDLRCCDISCSERSRGSFNALMLAVDVRFARSRSERTWSRGGGQKRGNDGAAAARGGRHGAAREDVEYLSRAAMDILGNVSRKISGRRHVFTSTGGLKLEAARCIVFR